jgi:glycerophosphoryl diester phosphodiesterase
LFAYERALAEGADALECDVRLTRDRVLVCVHDRRVDRTSSGSGVVSTLELADLAELDFGSWHPTAGRPAGADDGAEEPDRDRAMVLTLQRLLEMTRDASRPVPLYVETKHPTRYAGLVEFKLVQLLEHFGYTRPTRDGWSPVHVMSFAVTGLRRLESLAPSVPCVALMRRVPLHRQDGSLPRQVSTAGVWFPALVRHPEYVERIHAAGKKLLVWTVNEPSDVELAARLGVDGIITDRPAEVRATLPGNHQRTMRGVRS